MEKEKIKIGSNELIIRQAEQSDSNKIIEFLNFLFKHKKYDKKWLNWLTELEEYKRDYYIAYEEGSNNLCGIYGLSPVIFKIKSKHFWASQCCNIGIHPKYWGTNLFNELSNFSLENDKKKGRYFSFCSPRKVLAIRSHLNFGWKKIGNLLFYEKHKEENKGSKNIEKINDFNDTIKDILKGHFDKKDFVVLKDPKYLNWRYKDKKYEFFKGDSNSLFVLKNYVEEEKGIFRRHLIDFFFIEDKDFENAISYFTSNLSEGFVLHTWVFEKSSLKNLLEKLKFKENGEKCPLLIYNYYDDILEHIKDCNDFCFALGDDEAF